LTRGPTTPDLVDLAVHRTVLHHAGPPAPAMDLARKGGRSDQRSILKDTARIMQLVTSAQNGVMLVRLFTTKLKEHIIFWKEW